eukprot:gene50238-67279_t
MLTPISAKPVHVGGLFPLTFTTKHNNPIGLQYLASFLMAIREINDKNDGIADELLPNTPLLISVRNTQGDFIQSLNVANDVSSSGFNGKGIDACIGPASVTEVQGVTPVFNRYSINHVTYASTASFLSYVQPFPYYIRAAFSEAFQSIGMADLIQWKFNWKKVVTFSTSNSYGGDGMNEFRMAAAKRQFSILSSYEFRPGSRDLSGDAGRLLEAGYKAGLFHEGTQIIGSSEL